MLGYLRLASHYNIIDKPNERSSHSRITIRGGGIIFVIAVLLWYFLEGFQYPLFVAGFLIISTVSFIDDLGHVPNRLRITAHLVTVVLLLLEVLNLESVVGVSTNHPASTYLIFIVVIPIAIGFLNAYNFMDGINGITVMNALVTLGTLFYLNQEIHFMDQDLLVHASMGLLIFGFFNFRKKAVCFAGDVGAVSMAFLITFTLITLIMATENYYFIALIFVYGVDSVGTIIERLIKRENIFQAHRSHLYQLMANESHIPHVQVSLIYGGTQLFINVWFIYSISQGTTPSMIAFFSSLTILIVIFAVAKIKFYKVFAVG
mgnify:CR=1 FL=1